MSIYMSPPLRILTVALAFLLTAALLLPPEAYASLFRREGAGNIVLKRGKSRIYRGLLPRQTRARTLVRDQDRIRSYENATLKFLFNNDALVSMQGDSLVELSTYNHRPMVVVHFGSARFSVPEADAAAVVPHLTGVYIWANRTLWLLGPGDAALVVTDVQQEEHDAFLDMHIVRGKALLVQSADESLPAEQSYEAPLEVKLRGSSGSIKSITTEDLPEGMAQACLQRQNTYGLNPRQYAFVFGAFEDIQAVAELFSIRDTDPVMVREDLLDDSSLLMDDENTMRLFLPPVNLIQ